MADFDFSRLVEEVSDDGSPVDELDVSEEVEEVDDSSDDSASSGDLEVSSDDTTSVVEPVEPAVDRLEAKWDKSLQELNQFLATARKKQAAHDANPTEENKAALEKAVSNLAKFQGRDADSVDPFTDVPELAGEVDKALQERDARIAELQAKIEAANSAQGSIQSQLAELNFDRQYPDLAGKYSELTAKAREYADNFVGDETGPAADKIWEKLANAHLNKLRDEALSAAKAAKSQAPVEEVKKPKGTQTVSRAATSAKKAAPKTGYSRLEELASRLVERVD